jgi:hypothetical protein
MIDGFEQHRRNRVAEAIRGSALTFARVRGMRHAVEAGHGPTQIDVTQRFPYPGHRTQRQVREQMTPGQWRKHGRGGKRGRPTP